MKEQILVLVADYPTNEGHNALTYVHTRNIYYQSVGLNVDVINFKAKNNYNIDGVNVFTKTYLETKINNFEYNILICHAPNIRNHLLFLLKYSTKFKNIIFFFHGHEVLICNKVYSNPYPYAINKNMDTKVNYFIKNLYDYVKVFIWGKYYKKIAFKSNFVFVSNWMKREFFKWTGINESRINGRTHIIYNTVGRIFEEENYNPGTDKAYDFITIRGNLDGSKYCVDLVNDLAKANPEYSFLVIGKGEFFSHYEKAENLQWVDAHLNHEEIVEYLNKSRYALMPTRTDAQGLMMCEMATFGIPVITSDIPVCHEVLDDFENVAFIDNDNQNADLSQIIEKLTDKVPYPKNSKYFAANTVQKEVDLINELIQKE